MSPVTTGGVSRALGGIYTGPAKAKEAKQSQLGLDEMQELDQQILIPVSGTVSGLTAFTSADIGFEVEFYDAPNQRMAPYARPVFTWGLEVLSMGENEFGILMPPICAAVIAWQDRHGGVTTGCTIGVSVGLAGYVGQPISYSANIHAVFQGFGAIADGNVPDLDIG